MKPQDLLRETTRALSSNKVRSGLTILGIIIGIGSVVAIISIGEAVSNSLQTEMQSMGSNLIVVTPNFQREAGIKVARSSCTSMATLPQKDADAIQKKITLVKTVAPEIIRGYQITAKGKNTDTQVIGTVPAYSEIRNIQIDTGSFISKQNVQNLSRVAVLGSKTRDDLFGKGSTPIGKSIRINKIDFKVIGITKTKGGSGFINEDDMIIVPLSTAQQFLTGDTCVDTISVLVVDFNSMAIIQQQIIDLLLQEHNISNSQLADFQVFNQKDIVQSVTDITSMITIFLASIAGISLIVGGIGIMNMMLTTVTERTREIGLRRAVGAKKKDISIQFLAEAVMLTFLGGFMGIILGWIIFLIVAQFMNDIVVKISIFSIVVAFGISATIGIIFGYYPAKKAASLNPIEALRYE